MIPLPEGVTLDTPLRLKKAARIAFPDGSLNVSGMRREISRGRLTSMLIAGKQFTTIRYVQEMVEQCRVSPKVPAYGSNPKPVDRADGSFDVPHGPSATAEENSAQAALRRTAAALSKS